MTCQTPGCHNKARKHRHFCSACSQRKTRAKNKIKYAWNVLKTNAKRRGKLFDLTFEQFQQFAIETEYLTKKGIHKTSYHIDRINENIGYTIDNLQLLTNSQNVKKYLKWHWDELDHKMKYKVETSINTDDENNPF